MPLVNQRPITNDFNINSIEVQKKLDQELKNRTSGYNLNKEEQSNVKEIVLNRENNLSAEKNDFKQNYNDRVKEVFKELRAQQNPNPSLQLTPKGARTQLNDNDLERAAHEKTKTNFRAKIQEIEQKADNKINQVLDNAKEQGRGPQSQEQQQNRSLTQEFNRNR